MSDKEPIQNDYKVTVEGNEEGEYKVIIDENNPYNIKIEEFSQDKSNKWNILIAIVGLILIVGLSIFFCNKLDALNDKVVALQEQVENNTKEKLETTENSTKLKDLKLQSDDLAKGLLELQESNKALEDKLDVVIGVKEKSNAPVAQKKVSTKKEASDNKDYYLIEKPKVPANDQKIPEMPSHQEAPVATSTDIEIPKVPSLN